MPIYDEAILRDALKSLMPPGKCVELRAFNVVNSKGKAFASVSGVFDNAAKLIASVKQIAKTDAVYVTLNPVDPSRVTNKLAGATVGGATSRENIVRRSLLLIDCDPVRRNAKGQPLPDQKVSSTNAEHQTALDLCDEIACHLDALKWPAPIVADSGNGGHLLYEVSLPVDDDGLTSRALQTLYAKFSTDAVHVDRAVHDAPRISKLYGTMAAKGENTAERPHRMSRIISAPEQLQTVTRELLESLAASIPAEPARGEREPSPELGTRPGDIYNARAKWEDILLPLGWKQESSHTVLDDNGKQRTVTNWTRPGKASGVSATTGYCKTANRDDLLFIFSSATEIEPFESGKTYSKFEARALLEFDDDHSAAASAVREEGFVSDDDIDDMAAFDDLRPPSVQLDNMPEPMAREAFDGPLGRFILATDEFTEANKHARLLDMTIKVGNIIGRTTYVPFASTRHYPNLFGVLVGKTGLARKGETGASSRIVFEHLPGGWFQNNIIPSISSGEGLIQRLSDPPPIKRRIRGVYPAGLPEDDFALRVVDKRCLIESEEFDGTLTAAARDGSTVSMIVRQGFDGTTINQLKSNVDIRASNYHLSVIGHVTPRALSEGLKAKDIFNGFANRFIWCPTQREREIDLFAVTPERKREIDCTIERHAAECRQAIMQAMVWVESITETDFDSAEIGCTNLELDQSGLNAMSAFNGLFNEYQRESLFTDLVVRAVTIVLRLALIQAVLGRSKDVTSAHVATAVAMWRFFQEGTEIIFADYARPDAITALVKWIEAKGGRTTVRSLVLSGPRMYRKYDAATAALTELVNKRMGYWGPLESSGANGGGHSIAPFILGRP